MKCFGEQVGVVGLIDAPFYQKKFHSLNQVLYKMLKLLWNSFDKERKEEIKKLSMKYIEAYS